MKCVRLIATFAFLSATPVSAQLLIPREAIFIAGDAEAEDHLGRSVSVDAGTMVVGVRDDDDVCPGDPECNSGSVHVYVRTGTTWSHQQKITAGDAAQGDDFGESVAVWGDTIVIGAPGVDASGVNAGAVYVFHRTGTDWTQEGPRLTPAGIATGDCLGGAVGLEADLLVAGARFHDSGFLSETGSAYVYNRVGTVWTGQGELLATDAGQFDQFGTSVDAGTNRVVIGSPRTDDLGLNSGSAYVFLRTGTLWSQEDELNASNGTGSDEFGFAVSLDSTRIVVGAPFADRTTVTPGAAYVFEFGVGWSETAILESVDFSAGDRFGASVDNRAGTIVVGTPMDNHLGVSMGSAYVFEQTGTAWVQEAKLTPLAGELFDEFGVSVSTDATHVAAGSWLDEDLAGLHQGSGHVYFIKRALFAHFCFGDGGDQLGCRDCPCGNNAKPGTLGGCLNSVAQSGQIAGFGVPSVTLLGDTLRFEAVGCAPGTFGLLSAADNPLPLAGLCPPGTGITQLALLDGFRCAGGNFKRHGTRATDAQGDIGVTNDGWGSPSPPGIGLIAQGSYVSGQTRRFQIIYRDDASLVCNTGLNTTNAVSVLFVP